MRDDIEKIELGLNVVYKIPQGYHAEIEPDGRTLMLWKDPWTPKTGEVYYEPMIVQYKTAKKKCKYDEKFEHRVVFKTKKECQKWCKARNILKKELYNLENIE